MGTAIKIGMAVVSGLVAAISFGFNAFNIEPNVKWSVIAFIAAIVFIPSVFWGWYSSENRARKLESARPSIKVRRMREGRHFYLEVTNVGSNGEFGAQIETLQDEIFPSYERNRTHLYTGYWGFSSEDRVPILTGQKERLDLAILDIDADNHIRRLKLCYVGNKTPGCFDSSWVQKGTESKCRIRVTISSKPDLREGSFVLEREFDVWAMDLWGLVDGTW